MANINEKFALLADLGTITVPDDYDHRTRLESFLKKNRKKFYGVEDNINDANFPNPSRVLKPGDRLLVRAFKQVVEVTTEEQMMLLTTQKAVYVGAQGASLVFEQKRKFLPKGFFYASFENPNFCKNNRNLVPGVHADIPGGFYWKFGFFPFNIPLSHLALLCFCDEPLGA